jgi:transposase
MRYDLTDFEWSVIEPLLPTDRRGPKPRNNRRVLNGIFWVLRTGAPWRDLSERYGPYTTAYNRFNRWRKAGIWDLDLGGFVGGIVIHDNMDIESFRDLSIDLFEEV